MTIFRNHHEKGIKISTNMLSIGLVIFDKYHPRCKRPKKRKTDALNRNICRAWVSFYKARTLSCAGLLAEVRLHYIQQLPDTLVQEQSVVNS